MSRHASFRVILCPSIHAASTAAEWDALRADWTALTATLGATARPVFTPFDWPGFGPNPRLDYRWTAAAYEAALDAAINADQTPTLLIGRSLGAAYALAAAHRDAQRPDGGRIFGVAAIGPTGLRRLHRAPSTHPGPLERLLRRDRPGRWLYQQLTRPATMQRFMRPLIGNREVPPAFFEALVAASRDAATRYAVASFVGGALNVPLHEILEGPLPPVLLLWGGRARQTPRRELRPFLAYGERLAAQRHAGRRAFTWTEFRTLGDLPHVEDPMTVAMRLHWWSQDRVQRLA